jgi:hypothetical protein
MTVKLFQFSLKRLELTYVAYNVFVTIVRLHESTSYHWQAIHMYLAYHACSAVVINRDVAGVS